MRDKETDMKKKIVIMLICLLTISTNIFSQDETETSNTKVTFRGHFDLSLNYNDNILDYSSRDLIKFDSIKYASNNLKKFSISQISDNVTISKIKFSSSILMFDNNPTSVTVRNNQYLYSTNHLRNYSSWTIEVRQDFLRNNYLSFTYSLLPRYYIRNLWYHQQPERNPYRLFSRYVEEYINKKAYALEYGRSFTKRFDANISYEYEYSEYNREFKERNNNAHNIKIETSYEINRYLKFNGGYRYMISWAAGRENPDSTIADISYKANRINFGINISFKSLLKVPITLSTNYIYEYQTYLASKIPVDTLDAFGNKLSYGDKYHYGRKDKFYRISTELTYNFIKRFAINLIYWWENNKTNLTETSDAGSYRTQQVGIGVRYLF